MDRLSTTRLREILERAGDTRIMVVGDLMLDRYVSGTVQRISPEAPVPVVRVESESSAVGGSANVGANVVALGAACEMIGSVGRDAAGELLIEEIAALGAGVAGICMNGERPTTVKTRVLARHQQIVRFDHEDDDDIDSGQVETLRRAIGELLPSCDVLVVEDYNKGILIEPLIETLIGCASERGIPTIVDPKKLRFFNYAGCTVFKPNAQELADSLGTRIRPDDSAWMEATRRRLKCDALLLTLGERGMALQMAMGQYCRVPAVARAVYDVSGAGDTVVATVAVALAAGATIVEAAILANHAAAIEVGKAGVATVSPGEILDHYDRHGEG